MTRPLTISKYALADLLGEDVTVSWVEEMCRLRRIPHLLIAGRYAFTDQHVAEIISMHERPVIEPEAKPAAAPAGSEPTPRRRTRKSTPPPLPGNVAPLRNRGLPTHRLSRDAS